MKDNKIEFTDKILDNVHGFIKYTKAEDEIMCLLLFKRLQSIKQLSLVNWVFPGSEHTRFIHSLGVMHIADKIALQLKLADKDRKIIRLAGLLHDIGHYPLSHVCEFPYKKKMIQYLEQNYCQQVNQAVVDRINDFDTKPEIEFMNKAKIGHHEEIGALVIKNNKEIYKIIKEECGEEAIEIICDMITGNVERDNPTTCLLVQILHSELDADGIDYMLRDAVFSGTSFGSFEVEQLIQCMEIGEYRGKQILCISPKGIAAADQYLINKFFSYSQVVFNKHTIALEWMAEQVVSWMQENGTYFPRKKELRETWLCEANDIDMNQYIDFTDNYFWSSLKGILGNPAISTFPKFICNLCDMLLHHQEIPYVDHSEYKIVSNKEEEIKKLLKKSEMFKSSGKIKNQITVLSTKELTKHIPLDEYVALLKRPEEIDLDETEKILTEFEFVEYVEQRKARRLMDGISVKEGNVIQLLCDDRRSLIQNLCKTHLVVMRSYEFSG